MDFEKPVNENEKIGKTPALFAEEILGRLNLNGKISEVPEDSSISRGMWKGQSFWEKDLPDNWERVHTHRFSSFEKDKVLVTDGLGECIPILIIGKDKNYLMHSTAGDDVLGYVQRDNNYDPKEKLLKDIIDFTEGDIEKIVTSFNAEGDVGSEEDKQSKYVMAAEKSFDDLSKKLKSLGNTVEIKTIKNNDFNASTFIYDPNENKIFISGISKDGKKAELKEYNA